MICSVLSLCPPDATFSELSGVNRVIVPFLACGDLSAYDSDMTYPLEVCVVVSDNFLLDNQCKIL